MSHWSISLHFDVKYLAEENDVNNWLMYLVYAANS